MTGPVHFADMTGPEHFPDCHAEDTHDTRAGVEYQGGEPEACWHCGTPTPQGCNCGSCDDDGDVIPPTSIFHCPTCGRWWAYMTGLNITTITLGAES